jgi:putative ABC transport system permease protein
LGKRFSTNEDKDGNHPWMEIVGVVNDVRDRAVQESPGPAYYRLFALDGNVSFRIIAQTSANPMPLAPAITRVVQSVDKDAPITHIETVDQIIANSVAEPKFQAALVGSFGALGLLLAIIGIYGVISYSVVQQTHEIGVRMALGAQRRDILHMILREGMLLAITGIAIGIGGALGLTRVLRSMLFEIEPTDPATFVGVAIFLTIAALAACYIPARRAMKVDPMAALRHE